MPLPAFRALLAEYAELMQGLPEPCFTLLKLKHQSAGQLVLVLQMASPAGLTRSEHGAHVGATGGPLYRRRSIMTLQYQTYWNNDAAPGDNQREPCLMQERAHVALINGLYGDVYRASGGTPDPAQDPTGTVDDCSVNDPDSGLGTHADGVLQLGLRRLIDGSAVLPRLCRSPGPMAAAKETGLAWDCGDGPLPVPGTFRMEP